MQYKTAEVAARCKSLMRVNIYKDRVKLSAGLPVLPNREALQVRNSIVLCLSLAWVTPSVYACSFCSAPRKVLPRVLGLILLPIMLYVTGGADALILYAGQHRPGQGALAAAVFDHRGPEACSRGIPAGELQAGDFFSYLFTALLH